jgi:hypothetical protein
MGKVAQYLFIATLLALLFVYVARFPNHFLDTEWPHHAKAHLFSQISVGAGDWGGSKTFVSDMTASDRYQHSSLGDPFQHALPLDAETGCMSGDRAESETL